MLLEIKDVTKKFASGDRTVKPLNGIDLALESGTFASIVGKSGSGKSTLLSLVGALDKASSGQILLDGVNLGELGDAKLTAHRRTDIGFIFQQYNLIANLSAINTVMLPMEFAGASVPDRRKRAVELLESVELTADKHHRKANRLSGGEQQRVAIARALANRPKLILADEPTGNLDEETGELIVELLRNLTRELGTTIVVVTHDQGLAGMTDRKFRLSQGKLKEEAVRKQH